LPHQITNKSALSVVSPNFEVRGEVIIKKDDFKAANEALAASTKPGSARVQQYANPRNLASGILSRKHTGKSAHVPVKLTFVAYALLAPKPVGTFPERLKP
jgi:NAD-dependent DNA ligase